MSRFLLILFVFSAITLQAQTALPGYTATGLTPVNRFQDSTRLAQKWSVMPFVGVATGFGFSPAGQGTGFWAPVGLQLNRRINNNWYAFATATAVPAYAHFNQSFLTTDVNKNLPLMSRYSANGLGMYNSVGAGLMYINDARTFSISGSINYSRSSYPAYPFYPAGNTRQQKVISHRP